MADEEMQVNSPMSTSEATPPYIEDSPEMISQPSPPEELRVTSSTDIQPSVAADSPDQQMISSTSDQEQPDRVGSSNRVSTSEGIFLETNEAGAMEEGSPPSLQGPSSSDHAPEVENQPQPDAPPNPALRRILESPLVLPPKDELHTLIQKDMVTSAFEEESVQILLRNVAVKDAPGGQMGSSLKINERNIDSNQQFNVDDSSFVPTSKNLHFDSSSTESDDQRNEQRDSGSRTTDDANLGSDSSTRICASGQKESTQATSTTENAGLKNESSPIKTGTAVQVFGSGDRETASLKNEISPAKRTYELLSVEQSTSTSSTIISPKRKSPTKVQHLSPKKSAPLSSLDKLQGHSDSHMSTLIEDLEIKETEMPGRSEPESGHGKATSMEIVESDESKKEEMEQINAEVLADSEETGDSEEQGKTTEKH